MGFEDEVEQSFGRPRRQTNGSSKRTYELTSSIVPRGELAGLSANKAAAELNQRGVATLRRVVSGTH